MMKKIYIPLLALFLLLVSACGQTSGTEKIEKPTIKIGYLPITHAGPLYLDAHLHHGEFENYSIEMVKFGSWPDLMDALNTGRIDGASVLIELAMKAREQGIDLKAIALGHKDGNVMITSKEIEKTEDLVGKTYAIPHKFSTHNLLLNEMMKKDGFTYEDVNVVEMPPAEMPAALAENRIAGYVVAEPFGAHSVVLGHGKVHYHSNEIWPDSYCCVLVLRNDFIQQHEEVTHSFVKQYVESGKRANERGKELFESFATFMQVDEEVLDLSLEWISFAELRIEEEEYNKLSQFMVEMGLSEQPPAYEDFVDHSFIEDVQNVRER